MTVDKIKIVNKFIKAVFDETLKTDLNQMLSSQQGLDFPIILLVCGGIELMGALEQGNLKQARTRFGVILKNYFSERYIPYKDILYDYFRCGVAHQAFIKPGTATARNPDYKKYHLWGVIVEGKELLFIHPNVFVDDFFKAIEEFKNSFTDNPTLINKAYNTIKKIYNNQLNVEKIEMYKELPDNPMNISQLPQSIWLDRSDLSMGCIKFDKKDF